MTTKLVAVGSIKDGAYIIIDGLPCTVKSVQVSKTGKHGHAKCRIEAIGIIGDQKKVIVKPAHDNIEVPIVEKKTAQVLSIQKDKANVMDMETYETLDLDIPEELKSEVKEGVQVQYWIILDKKVIKSVKQNG